MDGVIREGLGLQLHGNLGLAHGLQGGEQEGGVAVSASLKDGAATLTVSGKSKEANKVFYMADADAPLLGDDVSLWNEYTGTAIEAGNAKCIAVAEVDENGLVIKSGCAALN